MIRALSSLGHDSLGHQIREIGVPHVRGVPSRRPIVGTISGVRHFLKPDGTKAAPPRWTSVMVDRVEKVGAQDRVITREILAESTAEVDVT